MDNKENFKDDKSLDKLKIKHSKTIKENTQVWLLIIALILGYIIIASN